MQLIARMKFPIRVEAVSSAMPFVTLERRHMMTADEQRQRFLEPEQIDEVDVAAQLAATR